MIPIIVSGASGQLGRACVDQLSFYEGYAVYAFDRLQLDIVDEEKIKALLATLPQTQFWINCAAYTKVDDAEANAPMASLYNAEAPGMLAAACHQAGVHLFHFSTDYVYDNELRRPLSEEDPLSPKSIYAQSKLAGEIAIKKAGPHHTILRTSWVYGHGGHNFVNTMIRLGESKNKIQVVGDQIGAPTYTEDIVNAVKDLIHLNVSGRQTEMEGTFNFSNAGEVTWDEFARTIFKLTGSGCEVETITTEAYGAAAHRPAYSVLNCEKISKLLKEPIPQWENALKRYLDSN